MRETLIILSEFPHVMYEEQERKNLCYRQIPSKPMLLFLFLFLFPFSSLLSAGRIKVCYVCLCPVLGAVLLLWKGTVTKTTIIKERMEEPGKGRVLGNLSCGQLPDWAIAVPLWRPSLRICRL